MLHEILPLLAFIVDTNEYSGNFHRELCGYVTGQIGEGGGHGENEVEQFKTDYPNSDLFTDEIRYVPNEHGDHDPEDIWPIPLTTDQKTLVYQSVAIFFYEIPSPELIELMKARSFSYARTNNISITGFRLIKISLKEEEINIS